jgi:hypothetical protein
VWVGNKVIVARGLRNSDEVTATVSLEAGHATPLEARILLHANGNFNLAQWHMGQASFVAGQLYQHRLIAP